MNKLDIINAMLIVVGEAPVSSVSSLHPSVAVADNILSIEDYQFQGHGWFFNTETDVTLSPASDNRIIVPSNTLKLHSKTKQYVQRNTVLYDLDNHTDQFTKSVVVDITVQVDIESLPPNALSYLCAKARESMFLNEDGEGIKMQQLQRATIEAYARLNSEHIAFINQNTKYSPYTVAMLKGAA